MPWSVATGERTTPPITQRTNATMKTAPKIVTRERVLAERWKICAIAARAIISESKGESRARRGARNAAGKDQRHHARAVHREPLHARRRHDDHRSGHAVGEGKIDGDV